MRYVLYILIFILFSCDSIDELGVEEYQSSFNYYDFIAYAWASFLQEDYDLSIAYFNEAIDQSFLYINNFLITNASIENIAADFFDPTVIILTLNIA